MRRSPIVDVELGRAVEDAGWLVATKRAVAAEGLWLLDESHWGVITIHGHGSGATVAALGITAPERIGAGLRDAGWAVYRLRPDQLLVRTPLDETDATLAALLAADTGDLVTVTDVTHGRAQLRLIGPAAAELLSRLCALDFHPEPFPDGTARQTAVAKTTQLVIRDDLAEDKPSFVLIGARSLGAYLWTTLRHAGRDLGIGPGRD